MKLGVIFGGVTCEHDVSIITGLQLIENVNKDKYEIVPIYIHGDGNWYTGDKLLDAKIYKKFDDIIPSLKKVAIVPGKKGIMILNEGFLGKNAFINLDVVIPAMHGMNGEDGTLQGLLELCNIPYTSSSVLGASIGMDKIMMKKVFEAFSLPVLPYTYFTRDEWEKDKEAIIACVEEKLPYPMFVKPANLGSSIGINKVKDRDGLVFAIDVASNYDSRIIVEKGVSNITEINCSALGFEDDVKSSVCERPITWKEFLTFDEKYLSGAKGGVKGAKGSKLPTNMKQSGMENMNRRIPADIPDDKTLEIQNMTIEIFKALNSKGVVRVDYIIDNDIDQIFVNEINTIPGSFSFYLWEKCGIPYPELIDKLVELAVRERSVRDMASFSFHSSILNA